MLAGQWLIELRLAPDVVDGFVIHAINATPNINNQFLILLDNIWQR